MIKRLNKRMCESRIMVLGVLVVWSVFLSAQETVGVRFVEKPFKEILAQAQAENKMVFIDCYTSWCGPCKMMATKEFPKKVMGDYFNDKFISTQIDMEKGEGPDLIDGWDVNAFPTFLVMNNKGEIQFRIVGYLPAEKFIDAVEKKIKEKGQGDLEARYKAGERSPEFIQAYLDELNDTYRNGECAKVVQEYLTGRLPQMLTDTLAFNFFIQYIKDPYEESFLYVTKNEEAFAKRYGSKVDEKLWNIWSAYPQQLFYMQYKQGKLIEEKLKAFETLMEQSGYAYRKEIECSTQLNQAKENHDTLAVWNVCRRYARLKRVSDENLSSACLWVVNYLKDQQTLNELEALVRRRLELMDQKRNLDTSDSSRNEKMPNYIQESYHKVLAKIEDYKNL